MQRQFQAVTQHDAPVIAHARHLSKLVVDMETGQRGFVITGQDESLEPYYAGADDFDVLLEQVKTLVRDQPVQVTALDRVAHLVQEWKETAAEPEIALAREVATHEIGATYLETVLERGVGKDLMDRFMAVGHELEVSFSGRGDWEAAFAVEIIEKAMTDREAGQRDFLITGREEFLEKYAAGEQEKLPQFFTRLRALVSERGRDSELLGHVDEMEVLAARWTKEVAEPEIAARREMNAHPETLRDVAAVVQTGAGKALIDQIRLTLDRFVETEEAHAAEHYATATQTAAKLPNSPPSFLWPSRWFWAAS